MRRPALAPGVVRGEWWTPAPGDKVRCELCPRFCTVKEGQRGFCFVRENRGGAMALTSYGRASGFCIDPIEKKPLNHFLPGTPVLSFGTAGCNLGCRFCQNHEISKSREVDTLAERATPEGIARAAAQAGCRSVAFTYNDPVIFAEYAIDAAAACRDRGIKSVAVTAGYITEVARGPFFAAMDAANVDLKAFTPEFYKGLCAAELAPVLDTLRYLRHETDVWFEVTTLLIPGHNDGPAEIAALADWFLDNLGSRVPLHFTAFHPDHRMRDLERTPAQTLNRARKLALKAGLEHVYVGNVHDVAAQSTWCASCGELLIERDGYRLGHWGLDGAGRCASCDTTVPGVFEAERGDWGSQRRRLRIEA